MNLTLEREYNPVLNVTVEDFSVRTSQVHKRAIRLVCPLCGVVSPKIVCKRVKWA
jgi:hypothetical protein